MAKKTGETMDATHCFLLFSSHGPAFFLQLVAVLFFVASQSWIIWIHMAYPVAYQSYHMAYPLIHAYPGWWFQPLWKIWKSDWIIIPTIGKIKNVPNHQPNYIWIFKQCLDGVPNHLRNNWAALQIIRGGAGQWNVCWFSLTHLTSWIYLP